MRRCALMTGHASMRDWHDGRRIDGGTGRHINNAARLQLAGRSWHILAAGTVVVARGGKLRRPAVCLLLRPTLLCHSSSIAGSICSQVCRFRPGLETFDAFGLIYRSVLSGPRGGQSCSLGRPGGVLERGEAYRGQPLPPLLLHRASCATLIKCY